MAEQSQEKMICQICRQEKDPAELMPAELVRPSVQETIRKVHPEWSGEGYICLGDLNRFRIEHVEDVLETEKGELSALEEEVVSSMKEPEIISKNVNLEFDRKLTLGEQAADRIAEFGGSWGFIGIFAGVILVWIIINSIALAMRPFDPYPYILLNLVLSCLAAMQAPVIMMSQNRQEARDRLGAEHDYAVNLKAELEIRQLNAKLDQLLNHQWQRLLEIQRIQMELMEAHVRKDRSGIYQPNSEGGVV